MIYDVVINIVLYGLILFRYQMPRNSHSFPRLFERYFNVVDPNHGLVYNVVGPDHRGRTSDQYIACVDCVNMSQLCLK